MLTQLKQLYQEQCIIDEIPQYPNDYYWYKDDQNHLIGIKKGVSVPERKLLGVMFEEVVGVDFNQQIKLLWLELLLNNKNSLLDIIQKDREEIRFIFFVHHFDGETKVEFEGLIKELNEKCIILFLNREYGVIIDFATEEEHNLEEIAQAIQQDFYHNINFYQSDCYKINNEISHAFLAEYELYQKYRNTAKLMVQPHDLLLQYMIQNLNLYEGYSHFVEKFGEIPYDLLEVAKVYMENNFNISVGAKVIYMHRNTFMNKLERFIQLSGLNIKEFRDALIAYLIIIQMESGTMMTAK